MQQVSALKPNDLVYTCTLITETCTSMLKDAAAIFSSEMLTEAPLYTSTWIVNG